MSDWTKKFKLSGKGLDVVEVEAEMVDGEGAVHCVFRHGELKFSFNINGRVGEYIEEMDLEDQASGNKWEDLPEYMLAQYFDMEELSNEIESWVDDLLEEAANDADYEADMQEAHYWSTR